MADASTRLGPMTETVVGMRGIVFDQTRQIDHCLHLLRQQRDGEVQFPSGDPGVFRVILTMIHMVGISGHSMLKLTDAVGLGVKDAFPIARAIIEGAVNVSFIMAKGRKAADRATRHAEVKSYRGLQRQWEAGGMKMGTDWSVQLPPPEIARLDAMLAEFTSAKGREKNWTDESLKQKLDAIAAVFPDTAMISLNASAFNIYEHASEVIHGSYFSAHYFWGLSVPQRGGVMSKDDFRVTLLDHQFSVLVSTIFAYAGLVECFASYVGLPELRNGAASQLDRLRGLPAIAETLREPDAGQA